MSIENKQSQSILAFLEHEELVADYEKTTVTPLSGDGSSRLFFDITTEASSYFCILPKTADGAKGMAEAHAAYNIGRHLKKRGISVPKIHGFDPASGLIVFENLGRTHLYDFVQEKKQESSDPFDRQIGDIYKEIVENLLFMQISGSVRFDRKWCWDTQRYDKKLMLEKESGYFMQAFCKDLLKIKKFPKGLDDEFKLLAGRAARQPSVYFLHRDFQSRNLMMHDGEIKVIDFQGARLGPLGYDLASLLIDPYVQLPDELQQELLDHYLEHLCKYGLDDHAFRKGYPNLALQRNLQILGAFAFLGFQKQKKIFRQFIMPAADSLQRLLSRGETKEYLKLRKLSDRIMDILTQKNDFINSIVE